MTGSFNIKAYAIFQGPVSESDQNIGMVINQTPINL